MWQHIVCVFRSQVKPQYCLALANAMDIFTACALTMVCKNNRVQEIMLTMYKDEVKAFARKNSLFSVALSLRRLWADVVCDEEEGDVVVRQAS